MIYRLRAVAADGRVAFELPQEIPVGTQVEIVVRKVGSVDNIEALEVASEAAYRAYEAAARQLHDAYWDRIQDQLPSIVSLVSQQYPMAVVEAERTEWTNSGTHFFDHWVRIKFPKPMAQEAEYEIYDWIKANIPLDSERGVSIQVESPFDPALLK